MAKASRLRLLPLLFALAALSADEVMGVVSNPPSVVPSLAPSTAPIKCSIDEFLGKSYRIPYTFPTGNFLPTTPYCFKIDLFQNGELSLDATDPTCSSPNFTPDYTISTYKSSFQSSAIYEAVNGGYNGHFTIREDPASDGMEIKFTKLNPYTRLFEIIVLMPSCTSPSAVPSFFPSLDASTHPSVLPSAASNIPSIEPSISSAPTAYYSVAACGSSDGACSPKVVLAPVNSLYLVRCCADAYMEDWIQNAGCSSVWSRSRFNNKCYFSETLYDAKGICAGEGGRLCSLLEVQNDCARDPSPDGCLMDNGYIWTSSLTI